jgi:hypothetical protein
MPTLFFPAIHPFLVSAVVVFFRFRPFFGFRYNAL